eukprot:1749289-Amphidinium_carterae.3
MMWTALLKCGPSGWEQGTLRAAHKAGVHTCEAMTGRGRGEQAPLFNPPAMDKSNYHLSLAIRH